MNGGAPRVVDELFRPTPLGLLDDLEQLLRNIDHHLGDSPLHRAYVSGTVALERIDREVRAALARARDLRQQLEASSRV